LNKRFSAAVLQSGGDGVAKRKKIKRYKRIYDDRAKKRRRLIRVVAGVVVCAALAVIGYSLVPVLQALMDGELEYTLPSSSEQESSPSNSGSSGLNSSDIEVEPPSQEEVAEIVRTQLLEGVQGVYMPWSTLADDGAFANFLDTTKADGYNAVMFDIKDIQGSLYYRSQEEIVTTAQSMVENPIDLVSRLEAMDSAGLTPIVRIFAFQDHTACRYLTGSHVEYLSAGGGYWYDNDPSVGNRWLNPESEVAQNYITTIALELARMGVKHLIVDGVQYPTGVGLNLAYYGERSANDKLGVLNDYIVGLEQALKTEDCTLILMNTATILLQGSDDQYGGNPADLNISKVSTSIFPTSLSDPLVIGEEQIITPVNTPYQTTDSVIKAIQEKVGGSGRMILPIVQYFDGYETGAAREQLKALEENGITCFILYNAQGNYTSTNTA